MKKKHVLLLLAMLCMMMLAAIPVQAANPKTVSLSTGKTYTSYDITGDGKADTIKFTNTKSSTYGWEYSNIKLSVNGKNVWSYNKNFSGVQEIKLYTLSNSKVILYICLREEDTPSVCALYQYKSEKMKKIVDLCSLFSKYGNVMTSADITVSGKTLTVKNYVQLCSTGYSTVTYKYKWKSGTLKRTSKTGTIKTSTKKLKAAKSIKAYKSAGSSKLAFTIKKGGSVTVSKCWISGNKMYLRVKYNGKYGWIKGKKYSSNWYSSRPFSNATYVN